MLAFYRDAAPAFQLLLFPEGSDLSVMNAEKSHVCARLAQALPSRAAPRTRHFVVVVGLQAFAEKAGTPKLNYVLVPRTKGWTSLFSSLAPSLDAVYDLTLACACARLAGCARGGMVVTVCGGDTLADEGAMPSSESALLSGRTPQCMHVLLRRYEPAHLPRAGDSGALDAWCVARFTEKEALLRAAYGGGGGSVGAEFAPTVSLGAGEKSAVAASSIGLYAWVLALYAAVLPCFAYAVVTPVGLGLVVSALAALWAMTTVRLLVWALAGDR